MNTAPPSSSNASKNYVSIEDMECATLLPRKDDSMIGKKNPSSNVSLKNVAYGLGIVALACSGSFVAGRSAAQYKLSGGTSQLGVARLGSKASSVKHSTAHSAAAAKKAKTSLANVGEDEDDKASSVEETTQPADPDTMTKEEMAEEIKQLRGYMTSLVGDDDQEKGKKKKSSKKKSSSSETEEVEPTEEDVVEEEGEEAKEEEEKPAAETKKSSKKSSKKKSEDAEEETPVEEEGSSEEEETMLEEEEETLTGEDDLPADEDPTMDEEDTSSVEKKSKKHSSKKKATATDEDVVDVEDPAAAVDEEEEQSVDETAEEDADAAVDPDADVAVDEVTPTDDDEAAAVGKKEKKSSKKSKKEAEPAAEVDPIKDAQDKIAAAEQAKVDLKATELEMKSKEAQKKEASKAYNHALEDVKKAEAAEEKAAAAHKKVLENPRHTQAAVKALMQVMSETRAAADQARSTSLELLQKRDTIEADWHNSWNEHERLIVYSAALQEIAKNAMRDNLGEFVQSSYRR
ncbi:unnamed protein product [Bathycoccus prasinos]